VRELCSVFEDQFDDDVIKTLVRVHTANILAQSSIINSLAARDGSIDVGLDQLLHDLLTNEVFGEMAGTVTPDIYFDSAQRLIHAFGTPRKKTGDVFESVSSSTTETLVFAKFCLHKSFNRWEVEQRWCFVDVIIRFIMEGIRRSQDGCV
jgi:hypothetical protein